MAEFTGIRSGQETEFHLKSYANRFAANARKQGFKTSIRKVTGGYRVLTVKKSK